MSLDRRLRQGLEWITAGIDPDVDWHLQQAVRGARRRMALRRASATLAVAAAIIASVVLGPRALDALWSSSRPPAAGPPAPTVAAPTTLGNQAIAGTYRTHPFTWKEAVTAIKAAGFTEKDAARARTFFEFDKTLAFTLKLQGGGQWTAFESDDGGPDQLGDLGTYTVTGDVLAMTGNSGKSHHRFKWTLDGTALSLQPLPSDLSHEPESVAVFTSGPFYRQ